MYLKCSKGMIKNSIPCQTVVNKMHIEHLPKELKDLEKLEKILICKRILSEKIAIMFEKIELAKVKGSISNILAEAGNIIFNLMSRPMDINAYCKTEARFYVLGLYNF